jgi:hypothetical protein
MQPYGAMCAHDDHAVQKPVKQQQGRKEFENKQQKEGRQA